MTLDKTDRDPMTKGLVVGQGRAPKNPPPPPAVKDADWQLRDGSPLPPPLPLSADTIHGPKRIGAIDQLTVGCQVTAWADTRGLMDHLGNPVGGIIVEITTTTTVVDEETGEIARERAFRVFDPYVSPNTPAKAWATLKERQLDPGACETTAPDVLARVVRRFARQLADGHGPITGTEGRLIADLLRLASSTLGGH